MSTQCPAFAYELRNSHYVTSCHQVKNCSHNLTIKHVTCYLSIKELILFSCFLNQPTITNLNTCLLPFEHRNLMDDVLPPSYHLLCSLWQEVDNFTICNATFLSKSFFVSVQWITLSNTIFCIKEAHTYTCVLIIVKIHYMIESQYVIDIAYWLLGSKVFLDQRCIT